MNPRRPNAGELRFLRRLGNCERVTYCVSSADLVTGTRVWVLADASVVVMVSRTGDPTRCHAWFQRARASKNSTKAQRMTLKMTSSQLVAIRNSRMPIEIRGVPADAEPGGTMGST